MEVLEELKGEVSVAKGCLYAMGTRPLVSDTEPISAPLDVQDPKAASSHAAKNFLPIVGGHNRYGKVYTTVGPYPTIRPKDLPFGLVKGATFAARRPMASELWKLVGGSTAEVVALAEQGFSSSEVIEATARALPSSLAMAIVRRTGHRVAEVQGEGRAGRCFHPEEQRVWERALRWFRAWRESPHDPGPGFLKAELRETRTPQVEDSP